MTTHRSRTIGTQVSIGPRERAVVPKLGGRGLRAAARSGLDSKEQIANDQLLRMELLHLMEGLRYCVVFGDRRRVAGLLKSERCVELTKQH